MENIRRYERLCILLNSPVLSILPLPLFPRLLLFTFLYFTLVRSFRIKGQWLDCFHRRRCRRRRPISRGFKGRKEFALPSAQYVRDPTQFLSYIWKFGRIGFRLTYAQWREIPAPFLLAPRLSPLAPFSAPQDPLSYEAIAPAPEISFQSVLHIHIPTYAKTSFIPSVCATVTLHLDNRGTTTNEMR